MMSVLDGEPRGGLWCGDEGHEMVSDAGSGEGVRSLIES